MIYSSADKGAASVEPRSQCASVDSCLTGKLAKAFLSTVVNHADTVLTIVHLFYAGSPFAIFRRIRAIIVDSFNAVARSRPEPHIRHKVIERLPSITNPYASATVVFEGFIRRLLASFSHPLPSDVFGSVGKAVTGLGSRNPFSMFTSAPQGFALP